MFDRIGRRLADLAGEDFRHHTLAPALAFAGIDEETDDWLGQRLEHAVSYAFVSFLLSLVLLVGFGVFPATEENAFPAFIEWGGNYFGAFVPFLSVGAALALAILVWLFYLGLSALLVYYRIEGRADNVNNILPDFLLLVASNINAGLTPFAAFRAAARDEFGPLAEEIRIATAKSLGTESFSDALKQLTQKIRSRQLLELVAFFTQSMASGGKLSKLLETSAEDMRQTETLKKELRSSTRMYVIFVVFIVVAASPLLLAVSVKFLEMLEQISASASSGFAADTGMGFLAGESEITADLMVSMASILLFGNALLASAFIGVLDHGKAKLGLKYFPLLLALSGLAFFFSRNLLGLFLRVT